MFQLRGCFNWRGCFKLVRMFQIDGADVGYLRMTTDVSGETSRADVSNRHGCFKLAERMTDGDGWRRMTDDGCGTDDG